MISGEFPEYLLLKEKLKQMYGRTVFLTANKPEVEN